ncbi:TRAM domain-containing protein [Nanoarchaeota archaeon]
MYGNRKFTPPVQVGDEVEVKIEGVGEKGDGVAKVNNFVVFVPGTKEGEHVKVRITKVFKKMAFAEVIGQAEPGSEPVDSGEPDSGEPVDTEPEPEPESKYEDTEDFGEDLEKTE